MGGRRLLGAALRAVHRPRLSVIVQAVGAGPHLEGAIRSVLNQSFKDLEVLVVVGQGADTQSSGEQVATRLSTKDRRVRVLPSERGGDPGDMETALKRARGRLVTIVHGGDALVAGACQRMIQCLDLSGSDVVVARSRSLTPSTGARQRTGPPREPRLGEPLVQVPEVVEDLVAGAVMARRWLWTRPRRLGALRTSPVSLPARTLSVLLAATRIDVLDEEVYTWRVGSVARGPSADTEPAALLTEVGVLAQMAAGAPPSVRRRLVAGRLNRDLVRLAERAHRERPDFVRGLRRTAKRVLPAAEDSLWDSTALLDRLVLWLLTRDDPASAEELEDLIGRRLEDLNRLPLVLEAGTLRPEPRFLERITVPGRLTELQDVDLRLHVSTDTARWVGPRTLEVRGCAWVWGVDPSLTDRPVIEVVDADGRVRRRTEVDRCQAPRADLEAGDPWRSYLPSGITVRLRLEPGSTVWFRVVTRIAGRRVWTWMPQPAGSSRWRLAPSESGRCLAVRGERGLLQVASVKTGSRGSELLPSMPIDVVLHGACLAVDATMVLSGTVTGAPAELDIVVSCSGGRMTVPAVLAPGGEWTANLGLVDTDVQLGTYTVGWSATPEDEPDHRIEGVCRAGEGIDGPAIEAPIVPAPAGGAVVPDDVVPGGGSGRPARRARIITRRDGSVAVAVIPPLTPRERSRRGRRFLVEREAEALRPAVFMESFGGRSGGDNPAAICEDLAAHDVRAPLWWSVVDGTVPVPSGAVPVVVGSQEWVEALRTSRVIVTNDHLPDWFSKREGQHLLQTWHGTPIKKLLHDAAPGSVSLRYQRLMARQVPQWDLLLAQNREAEQRLRRALGYGGQVRVGEYPRNVRLLGGIEVGRRVRSDLGIGEEQRVILYAPTWRERLRHPEGLAGHSNGQGLLGEVYPAHRTDAVVLMRTHHMNRARPGPGLVDVSRYPNIEELMMAADVLVSDYSSIFLDFALTGKPAVVYVPDLEHYRDVERGLYGDWPRRSGLPVALDHDELTFHLNRILGDFDVQAARREVLEVDPAPVLENLAWIRRWITRFLR
ncbi:bifunctional glycosyltransferase/CDP-glycerol:glycerophosphate glycerophosphotransferase [Actinomyces naeslundii]|uniref:bifunctional glycosyltransferase/CDP-glycerol:glycerophosphate glycerophosphotransferase n=1 Tax=Actinomyces naeslundii TaxID=1655 RepID=UPI00096C9CBC|nr:CDP-glycerol glycerophosphotransferase family protein [Actinomyces naeslundii]OMG40470.1 glycosyl transferase [Actinomyces naeslundii]